MSQNLSRRILRSSWCLFMHLVYRIRIGAEHLFSIPFPQLGLSRGWCQDTLGGSGIILVARSYPMRSVLVTDISGVHHSVPPNSHHSVVLINVFPTEAVGDNLIGVGGRKLCLGSVLGALMGIVPGAYRRVVSVVGPLFLAYRLTATDPIS